VEAGIFAFLLLVVMSSAVAELHGQKTATALVRFGFVPLLVSAGLIQLVLALPVDAGMYPPAIDAFPIVVGQGARLMIAGFISYGTSQTLNVYVFGKLAAGTGKLLWLRGMIASVISQVVDTVLFITISFYGERPIVARNRASTALARPLIIPMTMLVSRQNTLTRFRKLQVRPADRRASRREETRVRRAHRGARAKPRSRKEAVRSAQGSPCRPRD
jgi:uncharacterized integral membrane protein (TIGR00697 family)